MSLAQRLLKAPPPGVHAGRGPGEWRSAGPGPASRLSELRSASGDRCCVTWFPWRCFPPGGGTGAFPAARAGKGCAWSEKWGDHSEPPERSADVLGSPVPLGQSGLAGPCQSPSAGRRRGTLSLLPAASQGVAPEPLRLGRSEPTDALHYQRGPPATRASEPRHRNYEFACRIGYVFMKSKCV